MSANEYIWETFDGLFKTVHRQVKRVEELEARIAELERRLDKSQGNQANQQLTDVSGLPVERAA
jgi:BMFP domain-containing protein YqiC